MVRLPATAALPLILATLLAPAAKAESLGFTGANTGAIPDNNASGRSVTFAVSGLTRPVQRVSIDIDVSHTFVGDLEVILRAPGSISRLVLFSRAGTGRTASFGDNSNLSGVYRFSDRGGDFWAAAAAVGDAAAVAPGNYRASSAGSPGLADSGGCPTSLTGAFGGLPAAQANGSWELVVRDRAAGDTGTINAATLRIEDSQVFADGFDAGMATVAQGKGAINPRCINKPVADFSGNGLTDFALTREVNGDINWFIRTNVGGGMGGIGFSNFVVGSAGDFVDSLDFDGDRIADVAAWNPATGTWRIRRSGRQNIETLQFGQNGDDPLQSGDYDGDGFDDLAVMRAPPFGGPAGNVVVLVRSTATGQVRSVPIGVGVAGEQFVIGGFDLSGDGLPDIVVQRTGAGSTGAFQILDGRSGALLSSFTLGTSSDFIIPGNHAGDARYDVTVSRLTSGNRVWETRDSATGIIQPQVIFGIAGDQRLSGDYDGDGISDYAHWRASATPGESRFLIRPSTNTAVTFDLPFGAQGDFAVAGARVH